MIKWQFLKIGPNLVFFLMEYVYLDFFLHKHLMVWCRPGVSEAGLVTVSELSTVSFDAPVQLCPACLTSLFIFPLFFRLGSTHELHIFVDMSVDWEKVNERLPYKKGEEGELIDLFFSIFAARDILVRPHSSISAERGREGLSLIIRDIPRCTQRF